MGGNYNSQQQGSDCTQGGMSLLSVEWSCTGQGMAKYRTGSGEYALFIITKGSGSITAGGKDYGVNVGNVLAVTPETEVKIQGNAQDFFYYIRLCSCGAQVEECVREAGLAGETPLRSADCLAELTRTVRDMLEAGSADYVERLEQNCRVTKIWIDLIEDYRRSLGQTGYKVPDSRGRAGEIQEIAAYMKAHMEQSLKIEQIAREHGMNRSGLTRQFRTVMGCPPQQYLLQVRMERAKELLRDTQDTIGEIAARVGYRDALAFSHIFKEKCGIGPREYRKDQAHVNG